MPAPARHDPAGEAAARRPLLAGPRKRRAWSPANAGNRAIRDELARAALAEAPLPRSGDVLDAGCGSGWWLRRLAAEGMAPGRLHGVDLLDERLRAAAAACPGAAITKGDVTRLPYEDRRFAAVFLLTVLSSLPDREAIRRALGEARRILVPGGSLVIWEPRVPNPLNRHTRLVTRADLRAATGLEPRSRTLTVLPPLSRRLGRATAALYPPLARVPALRTHRLHVLTAPGG